jgi:hypothetical protein
MRQSTVKTGSSWFSEMAKLQKCTSPFLLSGDIQRFGLCGLIGNHQYCLNDCQFDQIFAT